MSQSYNRREFVNVLALGTGALTVASVMTKQAQAMDEDKLLDKKLGVALVGLGYYSTKVLAPALQDTKNTYLAGIVTGTPEKEIKWRQQYNNTTSQAKIFTTMTILTLSLRMMILILFILCCRTRCMLNTRFERPGRLSMSFVKNP